MTQYINMNIQKDIGQKGVIIIGGGLSGLTAAQQILRSLPDTKVTVLEAMDEVGGRTCSRTFNDAKFDLGGTWIGPTQKFVQKLAERSNNELVPQYHNGTKILHLQSQVSSYRSNIPLGVGIPALIHMQFNMWKLDRMANKLNPQNPRDYIQAFNWDSETVRSWIEKNIYFVKVKLLFQCAVRAVLGCETDQVSFLFFLWYIRQNGGIQNLINIQNGLQQKKMSKGAQHLSLFLRQELQKRGGFIKTKCFVKKVITKPDGCKVQDSEGNIYQADYIISAMPPAAVNKIQFEPELSRERKLLCSKNCMGSISKVLLLYDKAYWRQKGFSGQTLSDCLTTPIFNAYDESRIKQNGELQPAIVVFMNGAVDREWSSNRQASQKNIIQTLATYFQEENMLNPIRIQWKVWSQQKSLNGGPIAYFPPGVLTKITNIRGPQGKIHWAGTQMARQSQGFMDGAIESGLRAASEIISKLKLKNIQTQQKNKNSQQPPHSWYKKIVNTPKKWIQWL